MKNEWQQLPCGVPGYNMTALEYANLIKQYAKDGDFVFALMYLEAAKNADMLHRMCGCLK